MTSREKKPLLGQVSSTLMTLLIKIISIPATVMALAT